ncbi:MAG: VanZ family protein [Terriglobia bacterium]
MSEILKQWAPPVLWAMLISYFSTDSFSFAKTNSIIDPLLHWLFPAMSIEGREWIHLLIRKMGHWTEYFVFALLLAHSFRTSTRNSISRRWILWTLLLLASYAGLDELHQTFVASRTGSVRDSLLDFFGGSCAVLLVAAHSKRHTGNDPLEG